MHLSVKKAARLLNVTENKVRGYIASGELSVERKGSRFLIPEVEVKALIKAEQDPVDPNARGNAKAAKVSDSLIRDMLDGIMNRLAALEAQFIDKWQTLADIQQLHQLLREQDRHLAEKDLEIEKLRRDLLYQKKLCEKELEDHRLALQEKWALMEKEASERITQEHQQLEQRLKQERDIWSEKLAHEQERFAQMLAAAHNQEGFWSRLMKMITWS